MLYYHYDSIHLFLCWLLYREKKIKTLKVPSGEAKLLSWTVGVDSLFNTAQWEICHKFVSFAYFLLQIKEERNFR
jgi:hypothetical protein